MRTLPLSSFKSTNIEFAALRDKLGIASPLNQVKMERNPEQFERLLEMADARFNALFRRVGVRDLEYTGSKTTK